MAKRAARAQQMAAAQTIFLWLCHHRLQIHLAQKTAQRQQRKAALAHLRYKQEFCAQAAMVDKRRRQAAATREKALADDANEQRQAATQEKALVDKANEQCRAAGRDKALADEANEQHCHESAERATTLVTKALAKDAYDKDYDDVARQFEAYAAPLFTCVDAVMVKI